MNRGRPWFAVEVAQVTSPEYLGKPAEARAAEVVLRGRACERLNGGRFKGAKQWTRRDAVMIAGASLKVIGEVVSAELARWDGDDLVLLFYDIDREKAWKVAVQNGVKSRESRPSRPRNPPRDPGGNPASDPDPDLDLDLDLDLEPDREGGREDPDRSPPTPTLSPSDGSGRAGTGDVGAEADVEAFLTAWKAAHVRHGRLPGSVSTRDRAELKRIRTDYPQAWQRIYWGLDGFAAATVNPAHPSHTYRHSVAEFLADQETFSRPEREARQAHEAEEARRVAAAKESQTAAKNAQAKQQRDAQASAKRLQHEEELARSAKRDPAAALQLAAIRTGEIPLQAALQHAVMTWTADEATILAPDDVTVWQIRRHSDTLQQRLAEVSGRGRALTVRRAEASGGGGRNGHSAVRP